MGLRRRSTAEELTMSIDAHVQELQKKHQHLSQAVEAAQRSPSTDDLVIADLKKQKMRIKEEITRLTRV
jgi:hypothetical protein